MLCNLSFCIEEHARGKYQVYALVVARALDVLVRDAVNALQLDRVPGGFGDLVGVVFAVQMVDYNVLHKAEHILPKTGVEADVVQLCHMCALCHPYPGEC